MTYDETWDTDPTRRVPIAAFAALAALLALALSGFVFVRQTGAVDAERTARKAEVSGLEGRIAVLEARNSTLSGRLGSAEKTLKRRETGIAPLASRVLRSVFTVETENGTGSGFVAWSDGGASYLVTANHVIEGQLGTGRHDLAQGRLLERRHRRGRSEARSGGDPHRGSPCRRLAAVAERARTGSRAPAINSCSWAARTASTAPSPRESSVASPRERSRRTRPRIPAIREGLRSTSRATSSASWSSGGGENINFAIPISLACVSLRHC